MELEIDRRSLMALGCLASLGQALPANAQETDHAKQMMALREDGPKVLMLVHPKMVLLDLVGPLTVFRILGCNVQLAWKQRAAVSTDVGVLVTATHTFLEAHKDADVLFVPGGILGTIDCMNDPEVLAFLADRGSRAKWVTSVCTGGLVLAAAGLLRGYDATAHWAVADLLPLMGARHVDQRVVTDRNRMTGGGVTAGLDFGLTLAAKLKGEEAARRVQLILEYSPEPPFKNGTPGEAGPGRVAKMRQGRKMMDQMAREAAEAAGRRLGL